MTGHITREWLKAPPGCLALAALVLLAFSVPGAPAADTDGDGMSDEYEGFFQLNPTNPADAAENYDSDALTNLAESALWTDPWEGDTDRDGFPDDADSNALSRAFLDWGEPLYTAGDDLEYTWPAWMLAAFKTDGQWQTNPPTAWHVAAAESNGVGSLHIEVDRALLTNDARLKLGLFDHTNAALYADLYDTNATMVVTNLVGNLLTGSGSNLCPTFDFGLSTYPDAVGIKLRRDSGEVTIYSGLLYVDEDGDGLDAEQEHQLGTSDADPDWDNDALSDYAEVLVHGTDPKDADTDDDGMGDGLEVFHGQNPAVSNSYAVLPFAEGFETNTCVVGLIHGQNNWTAAPTNLAWVQAATIYEGAQALGIGFATNPTVTAVKHLFATPSENVVWVDGYLQAAAGIVPTGQVADSAALYFSDEGRLVVYDGYAGAGGGWVTLTNFPTVSLGEWARVTVKLDYGAQEWLLAVNGETAAADLGFGAAASGFTALALDAKYAFGDSFTVDTTVPGDLSLDGDTLPDAWELEHFGNLAQTETGDPDNDGLSNAQELELGTDPTDCDTDNDGMGDGAEVFHGRDPTDPDSYATLPFVENFETNTVIVGTLDGQHGWTAGPPSLVVVQTAEVHAGEQAAKLGSPTNVTLATAEHLLAGSGQSVVWCDAYMRVTPSVAPDGGLADSAALFFAGDGRLVVQDGHYSGDARWVSVDPRMTLNTGDWVRVTVKLDYGAQEWAVCLSNLVVADHLGFGAGAAEFSAVAVDARHGYADTLSLSTNMPAGLSMDWDQLPDEWELEQFGDLDEDDAGDPDYDGLSNLGEYEAGADPLNWDSDGDGLGDWYELYHAGTDPLDEDSDDDGLGDAWEHWYGLAANDPENPDDPDDDPDGDDLTNAQEEALGTNPFLADSDGDGVDDDSDANPLVADQGSDPGGPALTVTYPEEGQYILW